MQYISLHVKQFRTRPRTGGRRVSRVSASAFQPIWVVRELHALRSGAASLPANGIYKDGVAITSFTSLLGLAPPDAMGRPPPGWTPHSAGAENLLPP